jgi:hypothetical protein
MNRPYEPNWWSRNWKWFVPVGCLSMILLFVAFIVLIMSMVFGMMKSSDVYSQALTRAKADTIVVEALGSPIKDGYFTSGNISETGPSGSAELSIPISGPKGSGTIYLEARKSAGEWTFSKLQVEIGKTNQRIDLLNGPDQSAKPLLSAPDANEKTPDDIGNSTSL